MPDFLLQMATASRERAARAKGDVPERELRARVRDLPPPRRLDTGPFLLIAEFKRISPAAGLLGSTGASALAQAEQYISGGAGAISVLTEPSRFGGSLRDLSEVSALAGVPVLCKDFLVERYQVLQARAHGASGVLLIVQMLELPVLAELLAEAHTLGLFTLLECFDRGDLAKCGELVGSQSPQQQEILVGVNTRDLRDLSVNLDRLQDLVPAFPAGFRRIAESGMESAADVARAVAAGYDGVLVGSSLMRAKDPAALCRAMTEAGCAAAGVRA